MKNETFIDDAVIEDDLSVEETLERRKRLIVLILFFLILILGIFTLAFTRSNYTPPIIDYCYYDCDILNIGVPNYRVDNTGDNKPNTNLGPIGGNRPIYNVTYGKLYKEAHFNILVDSYDVDMIDYSADNKIINPVTKPNTNGTTTGLFNVDINDDGWPEINIDFEGKGVCDLNCDLDGNGTPDKRIDTDWDGICDLYCEEENPEPITPEPEKPEPEKPEPEKPEPEKPEEEKYTLTIVVNGGVEVSKVNNITYGTMLESGVSLPYLEPFSDYTVDNLSINTDVDFVGTKTSGCKIVGNKITAYVYGNTTCTIDIPKKPDVDVQEDLTYILVFEDLDDMNVFNAVPGWSGTKTFTVTNTGTGDVTYKIVFTSVKNTFTTTNNLYYGLRFNDRVIKNINSNRAPYTNGELISGVLIKPGEVQTYKISFEFRDTGLNQDIDKNKEFYTKLQVRNMN